MRDDAQKYESFWHNAQQRGALHNEFNTIIYRFKIVSYNQNESMDTSLQSSTASQDITRGHKLAGLGLKLPE
ncbi:uncharacterized protein PHALS_08003 [Plasmopara halstedii]|uniref:Uncharacterized protein n=1 Tax=Plasmopara halstedii TaxID=4781 RepID=A0A0P1B807_PLAHL|nr:uncharacterized protein PHALS_08003 [Plasmopara halstedii]CEG50281.1 hypothetical protein PHALS_08003 [Plasmopara halstedii]|eukprot:XP_024586650.1 hypothetical protein PHALS_08003 [Plasmopara halstedii]